MENQTPAPTHEAKKTKGIVLTATGHAYNGRLALNLAVSLKNNDPDIQIALVHDEVSISHIKALPEYKKYFKKHIKAPLKKPPFDDVVHMGIETIADNKTPYNLVSISKPVEYDKWARWHYQKSGLKNPFTLKNKTSWPKS